MPFYNHKLYKYVCYCEYEYISVKSLKTLMNMSNMICDFALRIVLVYSLGFCAYPSFTISAKMYHRHLMHEMVN